FFLNNAASNNDPDLPAMTLSAMDSEFSPAKLDLALTMNAYSDHIAGTFTYATDLFEPGTITTLVKRFQSLLQALVCNPDCKLLDIPLEDSSENRPSSTDEMRAAFLF